MAHSIPSSFRDNHFRLLRIVAGIVAHVRLLTSGHHDGGVPTLAPVDGNSSELYSVVLVSFENCNGHRNGGPPDPETLRRLRQVLAGALQPYEPVLPHSEKELLALLPGTGAELVSGKVGGLRQAFRAWSAAHENGQRKLRMSLGFCTCRPGDNLSRAVEIASAIMHPEADE
jgi:hypothetical protein